MEEVSIWSNTFTNHGVSSSHCFILLISRMRIVDDDVSWKSISVEQNEEAEVEAEDGDQPVVSIWRLRISYFLVLYCLECFNACISYPVRKR